ncbi:flavodoxin domain-containing protein [Clostridioides difficile]
MKNIIIYESKYGCTKESAYIFSKIIGYSKVIKTDEFNKNDKEFDNYIILSPIYNESIPIKIMNFIVNNESWLTTKDIYFCIVNLSGRAEFYLKNVKDILNDSLIMMKSINGNLILKNLDNNDFKSIKKFLSIVKMPLEDIKRFNVNEVVEVALDIKYSIENRREKLSDDIIKKVVHKFISNHNTCVLCTCHDNCPRATPIEYIYYKDMIYFISEGGVKFANILINNNVSIGIFNNYKEMKSVAGIQITGKAFMVYYLSDEYFDIMKLRKINKNMVKNLDVILNIFKVSIEKIEVLNTEFKKYNGDSKQTLTL